MSMTNILIADDEFLVRNGIVHSIPWEKYGFNIIGEAENGEEALEKVNELHPDILLTDIKMPVMDGLELIRQIRKKDKDLAIIILTCYDDFKYAQQALYYGVDEYLLKLSARSEDILGTLQYVKSKIENRKMEQQMQYPTRNLPGYSEAIAFKKWANIKGYMVYAKLSSRIEDEGSFTNIIKQTLLMDSPGEDIFSICGLGAYTVNRKAVVSFFDTVRKQDVIDKCDKLLAMMEAHEQVPVTIGISSCSEGTKSLQEMFSEAKRASEIGFYRGLSKVYQFDNINISASNIPVNENEILRCFENQSQEQLNEYFSVMFKAMMYLPVKEYVNICVEMIYPIVKYLKRSKKNLPENFRYMEYWLNTFSQYNCCEMLNDAVCGAALELQEIFIGSFGRNNALIARIKAYIDKNYAMDLTLDFFAREMNISYNYLSNLFRKEVHYTFKDYLNIVRINNARELLKNIQNTIYGVSEKVGYSNPYYFSKVFKKYTGMAPVEFKNKFGIVEV